MVDMQSNTRIALTSFNDVQARMKPRQLKIGVRYDD